MARVLLVSLYDEFCRGPRQLLANLREADIEAWLLVFKLHRRRQLEDDEPSAPEWQIEIQPGGGRAVLPYPFKPTEKEFAIVKDLLRRLDPTLVGLSVYSPQIRQAKAFTALVRATLPGVSVLWGGPHATCLPEECLDDADWAMVGEGDTALIDLVKCLDAKGDVENVPSLVWRRPDGSAQRNPLAPIIEDLDSLPFPWHKHERLYYVDDDQLYENVVPDHSLYARNFRIMTSRGCPFNCSYCMLSYQKEIMPETTKLRMRSIDHVIAELEEVKARRGKPFFVEIEDDVFTIRFDRMKEFFDAYTPKIGMPYWCYTHPRFAKPDMLKLLKDNRCSFIIMGIQSGSDRIACEIFNRHVTNAVIREAAQNIHASGLRAYYDLISNDPFETDADRRSTFDLIRSLPRPFGLQLAVLNFYPNLKITRMRDEQQLPPVDHQLYRFWNSLYQLASADDVDDATAERLLNDTSLREHPELVEWMAKQACDRANALTDAQANNERLMLEVADERARAEKASAALHDIYMRKGFRHFLRLSNWLSGRGK